MLARPTSLRRKKQSGEECGDSWERLQAADLTGDQPAAQNTMGAEVSGSLRRTPSRPPRSALGLDGVGAPRQAPAASPEPRVRWRASVHARNCVIASLMRKHELRPDFFALTKAENLQRAFAGGGKGLARAAARPALAITRGSAAKTARASARRAEPNQLPCSLPRHVQQPLGSRRLSRLSCPRKSGALTISSAIERRRT